MTNVSNILFINTLLYRYACPIDNFIVPYLTKVTSNIVFNPKYPDSSPCSDLPYIPLRQQGIFSPRKDTNRR